MCGCSVALAARMWPSRHVVFNGGNVFLAKCGGMSAAGVINGMYVAAYGADMVAMFGGWQ